MDPRYSLCSEPVQAAHLGPALADGTLDPLLVNAAARAWLGVLDWEAATDAFNRAQFAEMFGTAA